MEAILLKQEIYTTKASPSVEVNTFLCHINYTNKCEVLMKKTLCSTNTCVTIE